MRLFRRSLLCLVVGVTAFGAAGWGLRPRASWTVEFPGLNCSFVDVMGESGDDDPVWVEVFSDRLVAFRPGDGAMLQTVPWPKSSNTDPSFAALPGGRLLIDPSDVDRNPPRRKFEIFEVGQPKPICNTTLEESLLAPLRFADDGLHVWRLSEDDGRIQFECRDVRSGTATCQLDLSGDLDSTGDGYADYSAVADLLVLSQRIRKESRPPYGLELRRGSTGKLLKTIRINLPENEKGHGPQRIAIRGAGRSLLFALPSPTSSEDLVYVLDVASETITKFDPPSASPAVGGLTAVRAEFAVDGRFALALNQLDPGAAWVSLGRASGTSPTWHAVPVSPRLEKWEQAQEGLPKLFGGAFAHLVPGSDQLVVGVTTDPLSSSVPKALHGLLPASWVEPSSARLYYWHDWRTGAWRTILHDPQARAEHVRRGVLFTISDTNIVSDDDQGVSLLQSWPLPPRDPKWPALGVAALCAAATWWVCARRYRRRAHSQRVA